VLTFIFPVFLWLLLLVPLFWYLALAAPPRLAPWRHWGSLVLRTFAVLALVLALSGAQLVLPARELSLVFLLDLSDSVPLSQRARAETYVKTALAQLPSDDRAALIVFGTNALVERPFSNERSLGQLTLVPAGQRTNLQEALQLGLALLPAEGQRRMVLLSDGAENSGDALVAARLARSQGVPLEVVVLAAGVDGPDGQVLRLELPANAREGQALRMQLELALAGSAAPRSAEIVVEHQPFLLAGDPVRTVVVQQTVELTAEPQRYSLELPLPPPGFNRYTVRLALAGDARPENNLAEAYTFVVGAPRLLLIAAQPEEARPLAAALSASGLAADIVQPAAAPGTLASLSLYDAVALINMPRRELPERTAELLPAYVRELGRGLLMVGGENSFGAGDWRASPLEEALPVTMDLPSTVVQPPVSVVVVIDVSGSMAESDGQFSKVQLAAEGAARIAEQLRDFDEITVIPFDSEPQGIIGPLPGSEREAAIEGMQRIAAEGGGILAFEALSEAARIIRASEKPVRHIITITDGNDTVNQEGAIALGQQLRSEGVTISSISIGDGKDTPFIRDLVEAGDGRFFLTRSAQDIPAILTGEAQVVIQPYVIEGEFTPLRGSIHPIVRDLEAVPSLLGYVATTARPSAQVLLSSPRNEPVLAIWQYGLGRSAAWTADFSGRWAGNWLRWNQFQQVVGQLAAWLLPANDNQSLSLETRNEGNLLVLVAKAAAPDGAPLAGLRVAGQLLDASGAAQEVLFSEVAAGEYRVALSDLPPGAYLAQLVASDRQGQAQGSLTAGVVVPIGGEYRAGSANPGLLEALANTTGGRVDPAPERVFDQVDVLRGSVNEISIPLLLFALVLLPFDVAIRRLVSSGSRRAKVQSAKQNTVGAQPAASPVSLAPPASPASSPTDPLERMREAQERARKRARGEE
jgi:uncharacterized membrane protein